MLPALLRWQLEAIRWASVVTSDKLLPSWVLGANILKTK
jgi:hypothetical protein